MNTNNNRTLQIPKILPLLPVRDIVIFPYMVLPLVVGRERSQKALDEAMAGNRLIFLAAQKKIQTEDPSKEDIYEIGTIAEVLQLLKMPDGSAKILIEGLVRGKFNNFRITPKGYIEVDVEKLDMTIEKTPNIEALMRQTISLFERYVGLNPRFSYETVTALNSIEEPGRLADMIAAHIIVKNPQKQEVLEIANPEQRLSKIIEILNSELEILNIEKKIQSRVRNQIEKSQKEYYLTEQMKAIQKELRQKDDYAKELDELKQKIKEAKMSKEAEAVALKEMSRLEKMMAFSPEATVIRTYIDWLIALPWAVKTDDNLELQHAEKILEEDHYGLEKIKERIIEYLAVCKMTKKMKGPILCFVGPPGTGKTSIAKSIARSLGRKFVRISLGGVRDEAEIRGHRRTYIGALPGRILQSLRKAKSKNPVFLMDEIDKMGMDFRGDPAAALLEVLDPEQNSTFSDHYMEVDFDLSDVMFITTANTLYSIPPALIDRMEILRFAGYTKEEKVHIARKFLIPKELKEHGITEKQVNITDDAVNYIIKEYTLEAGVRNLEREIANVIRKVVKEIVREKIKCVIEVTEKNTQKYLGIPKYHTDIKSENQIGIATGLAWTEFGGDTISIEVSIMSGKGQLTLTGKLGDVMKESAQAALSYIRSNAKKFKIKEEVFKTKDIHIHIPEGAIPKDGPSAGITMATAVLSALTNKPVKKDIAMTGEITLRGRVLSIGGLKEKVLAAYRTGIKMVLFPYENMKDMEEIPKEIQGKIKFVPVKIMDEVIEKTLGLK
ncbi:MAG: endopeptidase La [Elusimicrobia bacterium RIFOXYD2_FULL_34_15]|nr:MAG: endopeptidase La [Elusimicrobia bacterium RIFOXYD2_FULL_34_15]